jgi:hypothetical protein
MNLTVIVIDLPKDSNEYFLYIMNALRSHLIVDRRLHYLSERKIHTLTFNN